MSSRAGFWRMRCRRSSVVSGASMSSPRTKGWANQSLKWAARFAMIFLRSRNSYWRASRRQPDLLVKKATSGRRRASRLSGRSHRHGGDCASANPLQQVLKDPLQGVFGRPLRKVPVDFRKIADVADMVAQAVELRIVPCQRIAHAFEDVNR